MVALSEESAQTKSEQTGPSIRAMADDAVRLFAEFKEYVSYLISLEIDRLKLSLKKNAVIVVLVSIAIVSIAGGLVAGAVLFLAGCAGLLGLAFGNFWIGATVVGFAVLALPPAAILTAWFFHKKAIMKSLRQKYAQKQERLHQVFNRDFPGNQQVQEQQEADHA